MAAECGYATRVGFEDGHDLPGGALAANNAALVAAAARILVELSLPGAAMGGRRLLRVADGIALL